MLAAGALLAFASCTKDVEQVSDAPKGPAARFSAVAGKGDGGMLKASGTSWSTDDRVGIYMVTTGQPIGDASILANANNIQHVVSEPGAACDFNVVNAEQLIHLPETGTVDFYAYYPYNPNITADYKYPVDVSNQSNLEAIDLLYATSKDTDDPNVKLKFYHKLTKVEFYVNPTEMGDDYRGATLTLKGMPTRAAFGLSDGTFTVDDASVGDITLTLDSEGRATALLIPGTHAGAAVTVTTKSGLTRNLPIELVASGASRMFWVGASTEKYFPDANLRAALVELGCVEQDGDICPNDFQNWKVLLNLKTLNLHGKKVANAKGIEFMSNLEVLDAKYNEFAAPGALNVQHNLKLKKLDCDRSMLVTLDVSKNLALEILICPNNKLSELDVSMLTQLKQLSCYDNFPTAETDRLTLNLQNCNLLEVIECSNAKVNSITLPTKAPELRVLSCSKNRMSSMRVSSYPKLEEVFITENDYLTSLQFYNLPKLKTLLFHSNWQLQQHIESVLLLIIRDSPELERLECYGCKLGNEDFDRPGFDISSRPTDFVGKVLAGNQYGGTTYIKLNVTQAQLDYVFANKLQERQENRGLMYTVIK